MSISRLAPIAVAGLLVASACQSPKATGGQAKTDKAPEASAEAAKKTSAFLARAKRPAPNVWVAGQPKRADLEAAKAAGITVVANLRATGEPTGFSDERATVEGLGFRYVEIPVAGAAGVTMDNAHKMKALLEETKGQKVLLHCGSGNRIGALYALLAFEAGKSVDEAIAEGKASGMTRLTPVVRDKLEALSAKR